MWCSILALEGQLAMIRWNAMVRIEDERRLGFVYDLDEDISRDLDDPACVRCVELFDPRVPYEEWVRDDHFLAEVEEVVEVEGVARESACLDFEYVVISNFWTEDTPPEQHYSIWIVAEDDGASVWLRRGFFEDIEEVGTLSKKELGLLKEAFDAADVRRWARRHSCGGWHIGSNAWRIELVQGACKVTVEGDGGYDSRLEGLCCSMQTIGVPIRFQRGHGLVCDPPQRKRRGK